MNLPSLCAVLSAVCLVAIAGPAPVIPRKCRYLPGDAAWPSADQWSVLNKTVGGRLISTVPLAHVCHDPSYDADQCAPLANVWDLPQTHYVSPSSVVAPYFQNQSCDPFTPEAKPCLLGNYVAYAINVSSAADIAAGVRFAEANNVRLVIKNTGHDLLGKSTGKGALGIWTHNLKSIDVFDYRTGNYNGKAMKMGAGVQAFEAYAASHAHNVFVLGGWCPTVGLAGGYTQGGGHSPASSSYGLAADNVLEWEVITAAGQHLVATPYQNTDLFWALSGGGAGTYGIVLSMTVKAHAEQIFTGVGLQVQAAGIAEDTFWNAVARWHDNLPSIVDQGGEAAYVINSEYLLTVPVTFPGKSADQVHGLMKPMIDYLDQNKVNYTYNVKTSAGYFEHVSYWIPGFPLSEDHSAQITGSHMFPRAVLTSKNQELVAAMRNITAIEGFNIIGTGINVAYNVSGTVPGMNAVNPAWRDTLIHYNLAGSWDFTAPFSENAARQTLMTEELIPMLEQVSPGTGSYLNEANFQQPDWQQAFYGVNYGKLLKIKQKYDPKSLLYATTAVGSEAWTVASDGRLCRAWA